MEHIIVDSYTEAYGEAKVKTALAALKEDVIEAYIADNTSEVLDAAADRYLRDNEDDVIQRAIEIHIAENKQAIEHQAIEKVMDEMREKVDMQIMRAEREKHLEPFIQRVYQSNAEMEELAKRRAKANQEDGINQLFDQLMSYEARLHNTDGQMQAMAHDFYHEDASYRERKMHQEIQELKQHVVRLQHKFTEEEEVHIDERTTQINADGSSVVREVGVHTKSSKETTTDIDTTTSVQRDTTTDIEEVESVVFKCVKCDEPMKVKRAMWFRRNKLCDKCNK